MSAAAIDISGTHPGSGSGNDDLQLTEDLEELASEWTQLESAGIGTPYHSLLWCKAFQITLGAADRSQARIALVRKAGRPVLLLPLSLSTRRGVRILSFLGARIGNQNTGLWDKAFYEAVGPEMICSVLRQLCEESNADCINLQNVPLQWNGRTHPLVLGTAHTSPNPLYRGSVTANFEDTFKTFHNKSARKNLNRKQRHLQEAGDYQVRKCLRPDDIDAGLQAFLDQREARARITGVPNIFRSAEAKAFLRQTAGIFEPLSTSNIQDGPLEIWTLSIRGKIRATYLCTQDRDTLYAYSNSVAHDEFLKNSPGLVLIREIVERLCADPDITIFDFGIGEVHYKSSWSQPEPMYDSLFYRTTKGKIYSAVQTAKTRLKSQIRNSERLWPMVKKLRRMRASRH
ncbi:GNAT family N-acetyltransferase [Roseibium sp.]|uniref:GNAT family N-acetyltransferase n=1 Tax=Roseibium sp. TaxID=1936156 RepID=UPI003D144A47